MASSTRLLLATASAAFLFSCKRGGNEDPVPLHSSGPWCSMRSIVQKNGNCTDSTELSFIDGRLTSGLHFRNCQGVLRKSEQRFIYDAGKVYILDTAIRADGDTVVVDTALRIMEYRPGKGKPAMMARYIYSTQGLLKSSVTYTTGMSGDTTRYQYDNGDLIASITGTNTTRYTYYDKEVPSNGFITQQGLSWGSAFSVKSKHLLKEIVLNNKVTSSFTYEFDSYDNVIRKNITGASGATETIQYNYMCAME